MYQVGSKGLFTEGVQTLSLKMVLKARIDRIELLSEAGFIMHNVGRSGDR